MEAYIYINIILGPWFILAVHSILLFILLFTLYKIIVRSLGFILSWLFIVIFVVLPTSWDIVLSAQRLLTAPLFLITSLVLCSYYFIYCSKLNINRWILYLAFIFMFISALFREDYIPFMLIPFLLLWLDQKITFTRTIKIFIKGLATLVVFLIISTFNNDSSYKIVPVVQSLVPYFKQYPNTFTQNEVYAIKRTVSLNLLKNYDPLNIATIMWNQGGIIELNNKSKQDYSLIKKITIKRILTNPKPFLQDRIMFIFNMLKFKTILLYESYLGGYKYGPFISSGLIPVTKDYCKKANFINTYLSIWRGAIYSKIAIGWFYLIVCLPVLLFKWCRISAITMFTIQLIVQFVAGDDISSKYSISIVNLAFLIIIIAFAELLYYKKKRQKV